MNDSKTNERIKTWIDLGRAEDAVNPQFSPAREFINSLGEGSRRTMRQCLASITEIVVGVKKKPDTLRWEKLTQKDADAIVEVLARDFQPATANKMLSAMRGTLRAAVRHARQNKLPPPAILQLPFIPARQREPGDQPPAPRMITKKIVKRLFDACTKLANSGGGASGGRRDAAVLAVFLSTGLRRNEALMLNLSDYNPADDTLQIRGESPEKVRTVTFQRGARAAMLDWLQVRGDKPGPLFLPVGRGGIVRHRRMTTQAVYDIIDRIARRADLHPLTTRDIRRAYVVSLIRSGKTHEQVKALTGHASWINAQVCEQLKHERTGEGYDVNNLPYKPPAPETPPTKAQPPETDNTNPLGSRP